jgi:GMP synthase (glutamine-hydrolysing)
LYTDIIESVSPNGSPSVTIKSHHNVGGLPKNMTFKLLEPLKDLFKDEVRKLGREIGISDDFLNRHPFPGPGLAIRIDGAVDEEKIHLAQEVDAIFIDAIHRFGIYGEIWQAFAFLSDTRSVGVMGDGRTYDRICILRAITSVDGMTADVYPMKFEHLQAIASEIVNKVRGINRVLYDYTSKPPATIEFQ